MPRQETLGERVTRLEVLMESFTNQISRELEIASAIHQAMNRTAESLAILVSTQDKRIGSLERSLAKVLGAATILYLIVNLFAPVIRKALNLPE